MNGQVNYWNGSMFVPWYLFEELVAGEQYRFNLQVNIVPPTGANSYQTLIRMAAGYENKEMFLDAGFTNIVGEMSEFFDVTNGQGSSLASMNMDELNPLIAHLIVQQPAIQGMDILVYLRDPIPTGNGPGDWCVSKGGKLVASATGKVVVYHRGS